MRMFSKVLSVVLLAIPAIGLAKDAPCTDIEFSPAVLAAYPNAIEGCHGITEVDGVIYAHYVAEVQDANKDEVTIVFLDKDGKRVSKVKFEPADATAEINDETIRYAAMKKGTKLDFWIPYSSWGLYAVPGGTEMVIISREDL